MTIIAIDSVSLDWANVLSNETDNSRNSEPLRACNTNTPGNAILGSRTESGNRHEDETLVAKDRRLGPLAANTTFDP